MGIRYYAYAFDPDDTERAVAHPRSILSCDPLADAWGLVPHATLSVATFEQVPSRRDMLYLDKAWSALQSLTVPRDGGDPSTGCHRMFEGEVSMHGFGWDPWVRTIVPQEVPAIREGLRAIGDQRVHEWARTWRSPQGVHDSDELRFVRDYLARAKEFVESLAEDGRGMVYMIG